MEKLSILNTSGPIDYDNLNIVTRPRPPRRRQSGISLVPFRPYVKCLTSIREPFAYANGKDKWITMGGKEEFFKQENARCIGTLIDDCHTSDVIRWDIEGESTRLPMMCKLWIIVDGAVVERGKPHLVQDAAVQVYTTGRNRRAILSAEQQYNQVSMSTFDRHRRQSWHDVNDYHSVPYYQYTRSVRSGYHDGIQCDLDTKHETSTEEYLSSVIEETVDEKEISYIEEHNAHETVHNQSIPQNRVQISIMTQTEREYVDKGTDIEFDFLLLFNLNLQTNENLLSSIANPYNRTITSDSSSETTRTIRHEIEYFDRSVSTGDDYPQWWLQLSTNILLSNHITNQSEEKKTSSSTNSSPRQQLDQSIQTDIEQDFENIRRPSTSTRSSRIQKSSSSFSITINDNFEIIDQINDGNNSRRILPCQDLNETSSTREYDHHLRQRTTSSKQSDSDYHTFISALNQQFYSTPDPYTTQTTSIYSSTNELDQKQQIKSSESLLTSLLERYERTLKERQQAIAIVNNELLDIDDLRKRYRPKIEDSNRVCLSKNREESFNFPTSKYRTMPGISSEEMLQGSIPSPRIYLTETPLDSPRQRQPRFDYCDLSLTDENTNSAWIRYNEQRIDQLQKRIDFMLEIDDNDENQYLFTTDTVTERINDLLRNKSKRRNQLQAYHNRILLPHRYNFRYPYRSNPSFPSSSRLLTRNLTRSTNPPIKSVRISAIPEQIHLREPSKSISQPVVSILRRSTPNLTSRSHRLTETSHIWKDESEGKVYILKQFSIPRYYRLYNDVSFREVYNFSRILQTYLHRTPSSQNYSSIIRNFAVNQQLPTITSVA